MDWFVLVKFIDTNKIRFDRRTDQYLNYNVVT